MTASRGPAWHEAALFGLAMLALASQALPRTLLINESRSLPRGLYIRAPSAVPDRGAIVAARRPTTSVGYLTDLGVPPQVLLLKRVAAVGGEPVCRQGDRVATPIRSVAVRAGDRRGRPLPVWRGCGPIEAGQLFLLGDSADSFDSRYFGPIRTDQIDGVYRELLRW